MCPTPLQLIEFRFAVFHNFGLSAEKFFTLRIALVNSLYWEKCITIRELPIKKCSFIMHTVS